MMGAGGATSRRRRKNDPYICGLARSLMLYAALCLAAVVQSAPVPARAEGRTPLIAAASDLKFALPELLAAFKSAGGGELVATYGSSGMLARQIESGAPFEMFLSADEGLVNDLANKGLTRDQGRLYALGWLAIFVGKGSRVDVDDRLVGLKAALDEGRLVHLAIANPDHAPYGRVAVQALEKAGLMDLARPRLVFGENAAHALQFALVAGAEAALVPASLVAVNDAAIEGRSARLSPDLAAPLRQRGVLMKNASDTTARFFAFVNSDTAQAILSKYGFSAPRDP